VSRLWNLVPSTRSRPGQLLVGLLCTAAVTGVRLALSPLLGPYGVSWPFYFLGVLLASLLGGGIAATTAIVASVFVGDQLFLSPRLALPPMAISRTTSLAIFTLFGAALAAVGVQARRRIDGERDHAQTLSRLYELAERCARPNVPVEDCLRGILDLALWVTRASHGCLHLYGEQDGELRLAVQQGFGPRFAHVLARVRLDDERLAGSAALDAVGRLVIKDISSSSLFAGRPSLEVLREAGVRSVQSTPLKSSQGRLLGMLSTHFRAPRRLSEREYGLLDLLARQAADYLERKRREEELRDVAQHLRLVTESMSAPVTRVGRDLRFIFVNQAYAQWRGLSPDRIIGRPVVEVLGRGPFEAVRPYFEQVLRGEPVHYEQKLPFADGPDRWVSATYTPTFDARGECDGWVGVIFDIDRHRRTEEALEETARRKDEFLAMLGHELRNPLSAIRNAVLAASMDDAQRDTALGIARRQTEQLGRLVDDLLDVARITQGRIGLRRVPLLLRGVVRRAIEASQTTCDELGHTLAIDVADGEIWVEADATRIEQVLVNLISNACKFTHPPGHISLSVAKVENEAVIRVRDSGIGIAPELLTRVFDLFAQADRSLDRSRGGLGIGLTVAQRIVAMHDGRIDAYSEGLGKGSEFVVRLPVVDAQRVSRADSGRSPAASRAICRVLLIEDNADAADSMRLLLEVLGHQVRVTATGEDALEAARALPPQLMLVDIGLPGIDGYEVARRVRRDPALGGVTLVALTGYGREEDKSAALAAGFDDHLVKPVEIDKLEAVARRARAER